MEPPKPAETVEQQPPAKTMESAKAKICAKNNLSNLDMIPLGMNLSMTQLLKHSVAHSTRPSLGPNPITSPIKSFQILRSLE